MSTLKPEIHIETDRLIIKTLCEEDRIAYMSLRTQSSDLAVAYEMLPEFKNYEWEAELNSEEDIYLSVFRKADGVFVASASIQNFDEDVVELGYDVVAEYRNQGIATELVRALIVESHSLFNESKVVIRVNNDNEASKKVAEKCGGKFFRNDDSPLYKAISELAETLGEKADPSIREAVENDKDTVILYEMP